MLLGALLALLRLVSGQFMSQEQFIGYVAGVRANSSLPPGYPSTEEALLQSGLVGEEHKVTSADGYVLTLVRAPSSGPPVLMVHGVLASSDQWVLPPGNLPVTLAEAGYDVWLLEVRGAPRSKQHVTLPTNSPAFWQFSFNEIAAFDIPAVVDYILDRTGYSRLGYVGHSMGTTVLLAGAAMNNQLDSKLGVSVLLAPVAGPTPRKDWGPVLTLAVTSAPFLNQALMAKGVNEFMPRNQAVMNLVATSCGPSPSQILCFFISDLLYGSNPKNWDREKIGYYFSSVPAGTSLKNANHLAQLFLHGKFRQYDYGEKVNMIKYGYTSPPYYKLANIKSPVVLMYGRNDRLSNKDSTLELASKLQNVEVFEVPDPLFCHVDFQFGINAPKILFPEVVDRLRKYL